MTIKPSYVKQLARELMEEYPEVFSSHFSHNKEAVSELTNIDSKEVRNRVAGFITHKQE